jgi:hypothetical protein
MVLYVWNFAGHDYCATALFKLASATDLLAISGG